MEAFQNLHPVIQALIGTLFTYFMTAAGAGLVLIKEDLGKKTLDIMLGFAAGVMIAASFWSLLAPAIEIAEQLGTPGWIPAVIGFMAGGLFLRLVESFLPHLHPTLSQNCRTKTE